MTILIKKTDKYCLKYTKNFLPPPPLFNRSLICIHYAVSKAVKDLLPSQ